MKRAALFLAALIFIGASPVSAQVFRCKGADGKVAYSDKACTHSQTGGTVSITHNTLAPAVDVELERRKEAAADARLRAQNAQLAAAYGGDGGHGCAMAVQNANTQSTVMQRGRMAAKVDADRAAATTACGGVSAWSGPSEVEIEAQRKRELAAQRAAEAQQRAREDTARNLSAAAAQNAALNQPADPAVMANCDGGGCWGWNSERYTNAGGGNYYSPTGKFCTRTATGLSCN